MGNILKVFVCHWLDIDYIFFYSKFLIPLKTSIDVIFYTVVNIIFTTVIKGDLKK